MEGVELQFIKCLASHLQNLSHLISRYQLEEPRKTDEDPETEGESQLNHHAITRKDNETPIKSEEDRKNLLAVMSEPKRPTSSFVFYFREQLRNPHKEKEVGKLAKIIGEQWKALTAQAKQPYVLMAQQSKRVYHENMQSYKAELPLQTIQIRKQKRSSTSKIRSFKRKKANGDGLFRKKEKKHKRKDNGPDIGIKKPKQPLSSFFIYFRESLARITQTHQEKRRSRLVQLASAEWKAMSQQEKERYEDMAKINKQNYAKHLEEYNARASEYLKSKAQQQAVAMGNQTPQASFEDKQENELVVKIEEDAISQSGSEQAEGDGIDDASSSSSICEQQLSSSSSYIQEEYTPKEDPTKHSPAKKGKKSKRNRQSHQPRGPISSFFLYYNCVVRQLKQKYPKHKGSELVKAASEKWALFSQQEKDIYQEEARRGRQLYDMEMKKYMKEYPEEASRVKYFQTKKEK